MTGGGAGAGTDLRIDHIAIAVPDIREAAETYRRALGDDCEIEFEEVESEGVSLAIIRLQNGRIELMEPTREDSPIKKFIEKKGPGLHHMAIQTPDIEGQARQMREKGVRFLGGIRPGSEGTRITFIHPRSMEGVLTELCSKPNA